MQTVTKEILANGSQLCSSGQPMKAKKQQTNLFGTHLGQYTGTSREKSRKRSGKCRQTLKMSIRSYSGIVFFTLLKGISLHTVWLQLPNCPVAGGSLGRLENMILGEKNNHCWQDWS